MHKNTIDGDWKCPQCDEIMTGEEVDEVRDMMKAGKSQTGFRCNHCSEPLVADDNCSLNGGFVINEEWVYG